MRFLPIAHLPLAPASDLCPQILIIRQPFFGATKFFIGQHYEITGILSKLLLPSAMLLKMNLSMKHLKRGTRLPIRGQKLLPAASPVLILPKMNGWCVSKVLHQNKTGFMLQPGQDSTASQRFHRKCSRDRISDLPSLLQRFEITTSNSIPIGSIGLYFS